MDKKKVGDLRPSQFLTTFGPGAVMDLPETSVIIGGTDFWPVDRCQEIQEPRLTRKLRVSKLLAPPVTTEEDDKALGEMAAFRFPRFHVCPHCRRLGRVGKVFNANASGNGRVDCLHCKEASGENTQAFPVRFIMACAKGHLSDFPWHHYVHRGQDASCGEHQLYLHDKGVTGAISDVEVECRGCDKSRDMSDAFNEREATKALGTCDGQRPWLGRSARERCGEVAPRYRAILRGASNAYFGVVESALAIPPFVEPLNKLVGDLRERLTDVESAEDIAYAVKKNYLPEFREYDPNAVWAAIQAERGLGDPETLDLLFPEWEQLLRGNDPGGETEWKTERQPVPDAYQDLIEDLIMVHRLVEVRALRGFTRIDAPADATQRQSGDTETAFELGLAALSRRPLNWFPGLETRGEGIFVALNEQAVQRWESTPVVEDAAAAMATALEQYCEDRQIPKENRPVFPGARYVLLHSLAHALMRQLCLHAGYSASSLRERIYARKNDEQQMAGLLIYTATPDSEGSLGGLVEQGKTDHFGSLLWQALEEAKLCSGDPLCAEHRPEAVGDQNGAACHACSLAAETSCERGNRFLDRSFLVHTVSRADVSFFDKLI